VDRGGLPTGIPRVAPAELASAFGIVAALSPTRAAAAVAAAAARRLAAGPAGDALERLEPRYLRAPRGVAAAPAPGTP
jgi:hypothetical protein